jgi:hypothetical protein
MFLPGDFVRYVGSKRFSDEEGGAHSLNGKIGEVLRKVQNADDELVVDFGGTAYVITNLNNLARHSHKAGDEHRMQQIERKWKTSENSGSGTKGKGKAKDQEAK